MTEIEEWTNSLTPSFGPPALHDAIHMSARLPTFPAQRLMLPPSDKVTDAIPDAGHILVYSDGPLERRISSTGKIHVTIPRVAVYCGSVKSIVPFVRVNCSIRRLAGPVVIFFWNEPGETLGEDLHRDQSTTWERN